MRVLILALAAILVFALWWAGAKAMPAPDRPMATLPPAALVQFRPVMVCIYQPIGKTIRNLGAAGRPLVARGIHESGAFAWFIVATADGDYEMFFIPAAAPSRACSAMRGTAFEMIKQGVPL